MKILSLILDGHGRLSAELCVSPDLKRREIAAATGGGRLIWCGLAAHGQKSSEMLDHLRRYIDRRDLDRWDREALRDAARNAYRVTVIRPALERAKRQARRTLKRPFIALVNKLARRLAVGRRTP